MLVQLQHVAAFIVVLSNKRDNNISFNFSTNTDK